MHLSCLIRRLPRLRKSRLRRRVCTTVRVTSFLRQGFIDNLIPCLQKYTRNVKYLCSNVLYYTAHTAISVLYSPFGAITRAYTADSPTDFWECAASLGSAVRVYAEDLLRRAAPSPAVAQEIAYFKAATQGVVTSAGRFQAEVRNAAQAHGVSLEEVSDELARSFMAILEDLKVEFPHLKVEFPPHEAAPSHEERLAMTARVMTKAEGYAMSIGRKYGMSDASVKAHFGDLRSYIEPLIVITGQ